MKNTVFSSCLLRLGPIVDRFNKLKFYTVPRDDRRHDLIARELARRAPRVEIAHVIGDRDRFTGREHREMRRDLVGVGASLVHY